MTTVDRRAVQEIVEDWLNPESDERKRILQALAELPSSNAQAVAWQCRHPFSRVWHDCTKAEYDEHKGGLGMAFRALCVCPGDARPVAVLRVRTGRGAASGLKQWDCQHLLTTYVAELPDGEYSLGIIPTGDAKEA